MHTTSSPYGQGDIIAGKYQVERVLGQGGMGLVVAATHLQLFERVAIKILLQDATERPEAVVRFLREARAAAKIKSEHVARVTDVANLESGQPYLVMEYLEGRDLARVLAEDGQLAIADAVELILQTCEGIAAAHALGIVHRDLKPANLFLTHRPDGTPCIKVLDFGIARATGSLDFATDATLTRTATMIGTPLYMSPEQIRAARDVDARSDIWSLGVILFQLLTGQVPFNGVSLPQISVKIATEPPTAPKSIRGDVPTELDRVIRRCLEKEAQHRFQTVSELARALMVFAPQRARASVDRIQQALRFGTTAAFELRHHPQRGGEQPDSITVEKAWDKSATPESRRALALGAVGLAAFATLLVGSIVLTRVFDNGDEDSRTSEDVRRASSGARAELPPVPVPVVHAAGRAEVAVVPVDAEAGQQARQPSALAAPPSSAFRRQPPDVSARTGRPSRSAPLSSAVVAPRLSGPSPPPVVVAPTDAGAPPPNPKTTTDPWFDNRKW